MAANSSIEWTKHSYNPWRGCTKVSAGCANCYAETLATRFPLIHGHWGPKGTRVVASEKQWKEPLKWDATAKAAGERHRVFCASMADVFEDWSGPMANASGDTLFERDGRWTSDADPDTDLAIRMDDVRLRLFRLIDATPDLDWLLLTKRPENFSKMLPSVGFPDAGVPGTLGRRIVLPNIWLGVSVENQAAADARIPHLQRVPAAVRFLSVEPMLGPIKIDLLRSESGHPAMCVCGHGHGFTRCPNTGGIAEKCHHKNCECAGFSRKHGSWNGIDWVICGGESGHGSRPFNPDWARSLRDQCRAAGVKFFMKQMGSNVVTRNDHIEDAFGDGSCGWPDPDVRHNIHGFREEHQGADCRIVLHDSKGGDPEEWPEDLRVRQFPEAA
jgi:protein gp37